jgi:O-acetyl-ADP-ribose deacetylase (regulator of RNase III)
MAATPELRDRIEVTQGDITSQRVDAIVNAANGSLLGGGGVDGAIHMAAGPELLEECRTLGGCPTGEARITPGYRLRAEWIIHTVGPVWHGGDDREDALLAGCYRASLELAVQHGARTVVFPAVTAGAYGFPIGRAARIAVTETRAYLQQDDSIRKVVFVCFSKTAYQSYLTAVKEVVG